MKTLRVGATLLALLVPSTALAGTDGTLGPTSNGSFNVTANISAPAQDFVQISGLDDALLSGTTGEIVPTTNTDFCLIRSPNSGDVGVTVSSIAAADTDFRVRSQTDYLPIIITIQFNDGEQYTQLNEGVESVFAVGTDCLIGGMVGTENGRMDVTVNGPPAVAGTYANTFLISVAPK